MKPCTIARLLSIAPLMCGVGSAWSAGFVSGSTGADGAFAPTADVLVQLPASGILNYTTMSIPAGVTVRYAQTSKVPVVILTTGDVNIAGTIDISGGSSATTLSGSLLFQCQGGLGGPGGFEGGRGGLPTETAAGTGYGPGGGGGGIHVSGQCGSTVQGGGGGGFSGPGGASYCVKNYSYLVNNKTGFGGPSYGSFTMLPLVGGSGGGGGGGSPSVSGLCGSGGGGGGGALMLVSSGTVNLTGSINAKGGNAGATNNGACTVDNLYGGGGGGGAGGAVRVLASAFNGGGTVNVAGGLGGCRSTVWVAGGDGSPGRTSIETLVGGTFNPGVLPSLTFTSIGGVAVPPNPSGVGDVVLPDTVTNPVSVAIAASGIPTGTLVKLTLNQPYGANITVDSSPLSGTLQSSTATASINIPPGATVLMGSTTYTLTLAMGEALSVYAQGETVEKVRLTAALSGPTMATLITASGKEYEVPHAALAMIGS